MAETQQMDDGGADDGATDDGAGGGPSGGRVGGRWSAEALRAARDERRVARLAREIRAFADAHGGAEGQIAYLGRKGARIVLVGADGRWGDLVAPGHEPALRAAEKAGITVHETLDGDLAARLSTGPYEWSRMAGIQLGGRGGGASRA
ncbi:hypothetical protein GCM10018793_13420 [Streptomyces sulfonofaciens]|uniref:Uncharacterized protein n=1 Tax=Streptomyces sulfonofaciens TaxID=68272 RepID=A0A919KVC4_9ACTN|nr:hypothetical protein [Streptomyces sulfonofaciens]GHH73843.1 hypothetical protein GCM10018793_13420 [Streptomyces sulfonofaciens]